MIIINATLKGENAYDITIGSTATYRVSAFTLDDALDRLAEYLESHDSKDFYLTQSEVFTMAECSKYYTTEIFARVHNLICCGKNQIYVQITKIKEAKQ